MSATTRSRPQWRAILDAMPETFVLGVTATPERLDGRGLGDIFEAMICGPGVAELTGLGFLAPALVYAPAHRSGYERSADGRRRLRSRRVGAGDGR